MGERYVCLLFGLILNGYFSYGFDVTVPSAGNCGDDTVLTCSTTSVAWSWFGLGRTLVNQKGAIIREDAYKYIATLSGNTLSLTIKSTNKSDEGYYKCTTWFSESNPTFLPFQCKASSAVANVNRNRALQITVDRLYPNNPAINCSVRAENNAVTIAGTRTCLNSTSYPGYYRCIWTSSNSLAHGSYTYTTLVTTITTSDPIMGSFRVSNPKTPAISNVQTDATNREVLYGTEGQSLTLECISRGGIPAPDVAWYKERVDANSLATSNAAILETDGTYTVTLQHNIIPSSEDDRKVFICRSYYSTVDVRQQSSDTRSVILYLNLKPSQPIVSQVAAVTSGNTVQLRCSSSNSRPAASIQWVYQGVTYNGTLTETRDPITETYTVQSVFSRTVTEVDNGITVQCEVKHPSLTNPTKLTSSVNISVQFPVRDMSTRITGNQMIIATGSHSLTLTCTTGSSNPGSNITWLNGTYILTGNRQYIQTPGENNGVVMSQQLILYPTRYMDGNAITCSVANVVSLNPVTDTQVLDLRYSPGISPMMNKTVVEGDLTLLDCQASSKPVSTFTWFRGSQLLSSGMGSPNSNRHVYNLTSVKRTDSSIYRCDANNTIGIATQNIALSVQ